MKKRTLEEKTALIPALSSLLVSAVAGAYLFVWIFQPHFKEFAVGTIKANTCLGLLAAALSLWLLKDAPCAATRQRNLGGKGFALVVFLIGSLTGFQYLIGTSFGIDELFVRDFTNEESRILPGRMSPIAALCFVFVGLALLLQDIRTKRSPLHPTWLFLIPVLLLSFQALVGYLYDVSSLYKVGPFIRISWQATLCFHLLSLGILFSRPQSGPISAITSVEAGGVMARTLLPVGLLLPLVLGWFTLRGQHLGLFGFEQGTAFLVVTLVVVFTFIIALNAKVLTRLGLERRMVLQREEKSRREAELERKKLHSLFLQAPAIISLMRGPNHVFELFNEEARKTISGRDATGLSIREALPELEGLGFFEALDRAYQTGEPVILRESPASLKQADGSTTQHYINVVYNPWRDVDGKIAGILNISVDVTEQVLARRKVEEALRARDEFLSIASHELKTPLTSLKIHLQMTKRGINPVQGIAPTAEQLWKVLEVAERQVDRLTALIEDMLDVARIQSGKLNFDLKPVNLASMIRDVVEEFAESLLAKRNSVSIQVSDDITGLWDKMRLEQVFSNLLSNAVKYAPGTPIEITARGNADLVEITVRDQGPGISKANQATLFERFERAGASRNLSGLGLGLFISKHIVETLGGTIRIESAEGHGAALIINLPLNIQHESRVGSA